MLRLNADAARIIGPLGPVTIKSRESADSTAVVTIAKHKSAILSQDAQCSKTVAYPHSMTDALQTSWMPHAGRPVVESSRQRNVLLRSALVRINSQAMVKGPAG